MKEKIYIANGNILYIYNMMKKYTDVDHPLKISEIIQLIKKEYEVDISSKTIRRNFKVLENKFGITIENVNNKYYMDYQDNDFDSSEIRALVDMVNYSRFLDETFSKQLTHKLICLLNEHDKKEFAYYDKYMKNVKTINKEIFYTIKTISEAILNKKYIQFDYYKYNLKKELEFRKKYLLFPISILCDIGQYYLIATNEDKNLLYFRLDRIKKVNFKDGKPISIAKKQLDDYIESSVGMFGGKLETIQAIVNNNLLDCVIDTFGRDIDISRNNSETFLLKTRINLEGFKNWTLRHIENVQVLSPKKLKDDIIQTLEKSLKKYN